MENNPFNILRPWQKKYIEDGRKNFKSICMWSRQIGKSFVTSYEASADCILNSNNTWVCVSTGERAAGEWLRKAKTILKYFQAIYIGTRYSFDFSKDSSTEIELSNGSRIISLPANPSTARGYSANLILDEMSSWENANELWAAIYPTLTSPYRGKKKVRIISTPRGKSNLFWRLWEENNDYNKSKVTIYDAFNQGYNVDIDELRRGLCDDEIFKQEYLCEPLDGNSSLFTLEEIQDNVELQYIPSKSDKIVIGVDIGRTHDITAIATFAVDKDKVSHFISVQTLKNKEFSEQFQIISNAIKSQNARKLVIDSTGIGRQLSEDLHKKFPSVVVPFNFTASTKSNLFSNLKKEVGLGKVKFASNIEVMNDLHKIQRNVSPSGNLVYSASRDEKGHADIATAVALAIEGAGEASKARIAPIVF